MKLFAAATAFLLCAGAYADFTNGMLARWTFNDTSSEKAAFTDDVGGLEFTRGYHGADTAFALNPDGTVSLGGAIYLVAPGVNSNSETFARLREGGTIWFRVKFEDQPEAAFCFGLMNSVTPGEWKEPILHAISTPKGMAMRAQGPDKLETGMASGHLPLKADEYSEVALIFNSKTKRVYLYVDGQMAERPSPMTTLEEFQSLMVGRLKQSSAQKMRIDEIRVYGNPLSAEWLAEIEAVEK